MLFMPCRMRPPDIEDVVRSKASDWAECNVQFGDQAYDAEEALSGALGAWSRGLGLPSQRLSGASSLHVKELKV